MTLPSDLAGALALIGQLAADPNLGLGLQTVAVVLLFSGAITWPLLSRVNR